MSKELVLGSTLKMEECKLSSFNALIYPYGIELFNILLPYAHIFKL